MLLLFVLSIIRYSKIEAALNADGGFVARIRAPNPGSYDAAMESGAALGLRPASFIAACEDMRTVSDELANLTPRYSSLGIPVEIIYGRADPILDYRAYGECVASVPNATLHLIEGGNMIPVTAADQIVTRIRQMVERVHAP